MNILEAKKNVAQWVVLRGLNAKHDTVRDGRVS